MEARHALAKAFYILSEDASLVSAHAAGSIHADVPRGGLADTALAVDLVDLANSAGKADRRAVTARLGVCFLSNDRRGDIGRLFESGHDRFWLLVNPLDVDEALLVPGLGTKANWLRLRPHVADHPLAHHFELVSGEKFVVHRSAVVRRNRAGAWDVMRKGLVQGVL